MFNSARRFITSVFFVFFNPPAHEANALPGHDLEGRKIVLGDIVFIRTVWILKANIRYLPGWDESISRAGEDKYRRRVRRREKAEDDVAKSDDWKGVLFACGAPELWFFGRKIIANVLS